MTLTLPKIFVRFVANDMDTTDAPRLNEWIDRIKDWEDKGLEEVNFLIHSNDERAVLDIAQYAIDRFNGVCDAKLRPLRFISLF